MSAAEISGNVSFLYCQNPKFCAGVIVVKGRDAKFSVKGYVRSGESVTLRGEWEVHKKYGRQFVATEVVYTMPLDLDGLGRWLQWYGDFIGPVKSQQMLDEFGMDLMPLCVKDPQQVAACARVPIESIHRLAERWVKEEAKVAAASQLAAWGVSQSQTEELLKAFGGSVVKLIEDDPYTVLGRVEGFGWDTTDGLAAKIGVVGEDPRRLRGAVAAVVRERARNGHTVIPFDEACDLAAVKVGGDARLADLVRETVGAAVDRGQLSRLSDEKSGQTWLATPANFAHESAIWRVLATGTDRNPLVDIGDDGHAGLWELVARYAEQKVGGRTHTLDASQLQAVFNAARYRISIVTGAAGSGKTLVARAIAKLFLDDDRRVALCAPTGKAARRLTEVIGIDGVEATTIHRLLEYSPADGRFLRNANRHLFEDYWDDEQAEWKRLPEPGGIVIADEGSMIDSELGSHLVSAIGPHTALVLIGDPNQLPPVGAGAPFRDAIGHTLAPVARLEQCHRQAGTLKTNCTLVLKGVVEPWVTDEAPSPWVVSRKCDTPERIVAVIEELYASRLAEWGYDPVTGTQFMTAKHDGRLGTKRLNLILQRLHQKSLGNDLGPIGPDEHEERPTLYPGDKVIQGRNNYDLGVMNGTIGVVEKAKPGLVVDFGDVTVEYPKANAGEVSLAYCLTPHRMQGSEVRCAVGIVPKAHAFMQHRHWLYTLVTRARNTAVILGDADGIRRAAEKVENDRRETVLQVFARYEGVRS